MESIAPSNTLVIDLSTKICGICINGDTSTAVFWDNDVEESVHLIRHWMNTHIPTRPLTQVLIELANFQNAKLTSRFNRLAGRIEALISNNQFEPIEFKTFNANEWHRLMHIPSTDIREICKLKARRYAFLKTNNIKYIAPLTADQIAYSINQYYNRLKYKNERPTDFANYIKNLEHSYRDIEWQTTDDEADAYCIWDNREFIRDEQVIKSATKQKYKSFQTNKMREVKDKLRNEKRKNYIITELQKYPQEIYTYQLRTQKKLAKLKEELESLV